MKTAAAGTVYRFDGFVLDLARGALLTEGGNDVRLRHKSFNLLLLFVANAGRLLDRDTINQTLWPDVVVSDDGITQCVGDIRRALGDVAQATLKTVPRRGYIFAAKVTAICEVGQPISNIFPLPDKPSIAVLAFANMSGDPDQEHLSDGISDSIITELSRNRSLFVIARTSSFAYKSQAVGVKQVALDLGVQYVVEGSLMRSGNRIRIAAQLIDAGTASHIWAERFDRNLADLFSVQDEIARAIVAAIDPAISQVERQRAMQKPPENLSAWEAWQRALWHWSKGDALSTRREFLQRAVALDPRFAPAHAALAWLYLSESTRGSGLSLREGGRIAEAEARIAIDLDPYSAIAHAALAWVLDHQGDQGAALEEAETAIALNPNDPHGYLIKGHILALSDRSAEAREPLTTALRLDPRGPTAPAVMYNLAVGCYHERDYPAAEATTRRAVRAYPEHPRSYLLLAATLGQLGRTDEARATLDAAIALSPSYVKIKTAGRAPYYRPEDYEHMLDGLRKAGWQG